MNQGFNETITIGKSRRDIAGIVFVTPTSRVVRTAIVTTKRGSLLSVARYPWKVRQEIELAILEQV